MCWRWSRRTPLLLAVVGGDLGITYVTLVLLVWRMQTIRAMEAWARQRGGCKREMWGGKAKAVETRQTQGWHQEHGHFPGKAGAAARAVKTREPQQQGLPCPAASPDRPTCPGARRAVSTVYLATFWFALVYLFLLFYFFLLE